MPQGLVLAILLAGLHGGAGQRPAEDACDASPGAAGCRAPPAPEVPDLVSMLQEQASRRARGVKTGHSKMGESDRAGAEEQGPTDVALVVAGADKARKRGKWNCWLNGWGGTQNVDCVLNDWQDWSACSKTCGGGSRTRIRTVKIAKQCHGNECNSTRAQTEDCSTAECPVDCVLNDWEDWSDCSKTCGNGTRSRSRTVSISAQHGGEACGDGEDTEDCGEACPVDCVHSDWGEWGACSKTCGDGTRSRSRSVVTSAQHGGEACGDGEDTEDCGEACPVDCVLSDWGEWGDCSKTCADAWKLRYRTVTTAASHGGQPCNHTLDYEQCSVPNCPQRLQNMKDDSMCLDYNVGWGSHHNVYVHKCHNDKNQQWEMDHLGRLRSMYNYNCLENDDSGNVKMSRCHTGENQKWDKWNDFPEFSGHVTSKKDDYCLDWDERASSNNNVRMLPCGTGKDMEWKLV